jgi:pimeloyl-CoA dehydrogenase small subunit
MNFSLDDDQRMLKDTVDRLVARDYGFEQRRAYLKSPEGWSRTMWARMAEIGLLALPFPSAHGGLDGGPIETMLVMESLGRAMVLEPLLSTTVICAAALKAANAEQHERWVPAIAGGKLVVAWAHEEAQSRYVSSDVACSATPKGDGHLIDGVKPLVLHGDSAGKLLVSARVDGRRTDPKGIALFMVDADAPGVTRRTCRTHDGLRAAVVALAGVEVGADDMIGEAGEALTIIERVAEVAIAALAAEAVGAMSAALEMTVEYLKTRHQFGAAIGRFQALQHRAAEMLIATEQARSMAMYAALMLGEPDAAERRKALSAVKVQIGNSARFVGQQAIQLHGGIGVTDEYAIGHYFKRLTMIESRFGDADHHLAAFARAGGFIAPATAAA